MIKASIHQKSIHQSTLLYLLLHLSSSHLFYGRPGGSDGKESACNAGDPGLISGSRRSPGERNGNPLQYSCLGNSIDRGAWWAIVHGVTESWTQLSDEHFHFHGLGQSRRGREKVKMKKTEKEHKREREEER